METIRAEEIRIPRRAREAVAHHEPVLVVNRERPAFVIVHPDDHESGVQPAPPRRSLRTALSLLSQASRPDPEFADDMEAVLDSVGPVPADPWERS